MSKEVSLIHRVGNVIMDVRRRVYEARQGDGGSPMDGWIGFEAYQQVLYDAEPTLRHAMMMPEPTAKPGEFKLMGVQFRRDTAMPPRSIVICVGGAPVRRIALDYPEFDKEPVVDHPGALAFEIMALRYFDRRGDIIMPAKTPEIVIDEIHRLPPEGEPLKIKSISTDRLVELGLLFREQRENSVVFGLTLMGREALRQFEASP